ncbi:MAG: FAD-binding protein [Rhodospirillaceae bacterium]|nr:FAD-binding protein [Rhodospirillaceae bacterium]
MENYHFDLIVIGAGMSGMTAVITALNQGLRVGIVNTGFGLFVFGSGCIENCQTLHKEAPENFNKAIDLFLENARLAECPFYGSINEIRYLPTIMGGFQAVSFAPFYLWKGNASESIRSAVVGINGVSSFNADYTAERLNYTAKFNDFKTNYVAKEINLSIKPKSVASMLQFANRFDFDSRFYDELQEALKPISREADLIIIPGIFGLRSKFQKIYDFEHELDCNLCELSNIPPSIPGLRLFNVLIAHLRKNGAEFFSGFSVKNLEIKNGHCQTIEVDIPARSLCIDFDSIILATGQFSKSLIGLDFFDVDEWLRPITKSGTVIADNLYAIGDLLRNVGGNDNRHSILTGYRAGMSIVERR